MKKQNKSIVKGKKSAKTLQKRPAVTKPENISNEEKAVLNEISRVSINARRRAYNNNASVTIIRNGKILRINSKRKEQVVGKVKKTPIKIDTTKPIRIK